MNISIEIIEDMLPNSALPCGKAVPCIAEMDGLIDGVSPAYYIRGLQFYMPMIRQYLEYQNGAVVTNHGSTAGSHPRVFYPN